LLEKSIEIDIFSGSGGGEWGKGRMHEHDAF
jgi:hypothetical protein